MFWVAFSNAELGIIDTSLHDQARTLLAAIPRDPHETYRDSDLIPNETPLGVAVGALLLDDHGKVLDDTPQAPAAAQLVPLIAQVRAQGPVLATRRVGGEEQRVLAERADIVPGRSATLVLTRPLVEFEQTMARTTLYLLVTVLALVVIASLLGYWFAGRVLRPVRTMAETARDLSEHDLHRRIALDLPADELGELATTLNGMLARLEAAFASLQRFTADAAHELRAPLALMRTEVEVALREGVASDDARRVLDTVVAEVNRLSRTADQLLLLARADAGVLEPLREEVDVTDLLEEIAARWKPTLDERGIELVTAIPTDGGRLLADGGMLRRLLDNLVDNAGRYTAPHGRIVLAGRAVHGGWELTVADTGPGIDPSLRDRVFERFTRADSARGRDTGGAGLGLSLCAAIAELHSGTLVLDPAHRGTRWVLRLPHPPPAPLRAAG